MSAGLTRTVARVVLSPGVDRPGFANAPQGLAGHLARRLDIEPGDALVGVAQLAVGARDLG